jgi:hypothetical protein
MPVGHRQQVSASGLEPLGFLQALALGAMPIPARVVRNTGPPAGIAGIHVTPESGRAALDDVAHDGPLGCGDAVPLPVGFPVAPS